jgi:hypothetical protein
MWYDCNRRDSLKLLVMGGLGSLLPSSQALAREDESLGQWYTVKSGDNPRKLAKLVKGSTGHINNVVEIIGKVNDLQCPEYSSYTRRSPAGCSGEAEDRWLRVGEKLLLPKEYYPHMVDGVQVTILKIQKDAKKYE